MKTKYHFNEVVGCAVVKVVGEFSTNDKDIDNYFQLISDIFCEFKTNKIIVDYSKLIYNQTISQIVKGSRRAQKYNLDNELYRIALVFNYNSETYKNYRLFLADIDTKKFLGNIKTIYKIFGSFDDALSWIKEVQ